MGAVGQSNTVEWVGRINRVGSSSAMVVPKKLCDQMGLKRGDYMAIVQIGSTLICRRIERHMILDHDKAAQKAIEAQVIGINHGA